MSNLGTLWFDVDLNLTKLQEKIRNGNTQVLKDLKVSLAPDAVELKRTIESILQGQSFNVNLKASEESINKIKEQLGQLSGDIKLTSSGGMLSAESIKSIVNLLSQQAQKTQEVTTATQSATDASKAAAKATNDEAESAKKANVERERQMKLLYEVQMMYSKIANLSPEKSGMSPSKINAVADSFQNLANKLKDVPPKTSLQELAAEFSTLKAQTRGFFQEVGQSSKAVESIRLVRYALKEVNDQIASGTSSTKLEGFREQLQAINREMHNMMKAGDFTGIQNLFAGHKGFSDGVVNIIRQMVTEMRKLGVATQETIGITSHLTEAEQKLAASIKSSTDSMRGQSQVLSDLKTMAMQYLSIWGAQSFVNSIIQTGGLLEQQRMSIGAILGDLSQANHLFGQITQLALKSPFGVVQLDTMSKQLTAYNFKYSELYDWTKRLADISAATGTEVSRLALALGHVRSEGALSGYTLRQFAMGNVPLLQTLATQLGKTTSEIRKMTREKAITYEDVEQALRTLTEEGGIFFNAQEVMSNALNAKFKNLHDAFDIMFGDMAESAVGDSLKKIAETLTLLAKHWKEVGAQVVVVVGTLAAYKAIQATVNAGLLRSGVMAGQYSAKQLELLATTGKLNRELLLQAVAAGKVSVADAEAAGAVYNLTRAQLEAVAATGKTSAAFDVAAIAGGKYATSTQLLAAQFKSASWLSMTKWATGAKLAWTGLTGAIGAATTAVKGFLTTMWPLLAISVFTEVFMRMSQKSEELDEFLKDLSQTANEASKNLGEITKNFSIGSSEGKDTKQLTEDIEEMVEQLKSYSENASETFKNAFAIDEEGKSVHSLAEQYEILAQALMNTKKGYERLGEHSDIITEAIANIDVMNDQNWFLQSLGELGKFLLGRFLDDTTEATLGGLNEALSNYVQKVKEADIAENRLLQHRIELNNALEAAGYTNVDAMSDNERLIHALHFTQEIPESATEEERLRYLSFFASLSEDMKDLLDDVQETSEGFNAAYELAGARALKAGKEIKQALIGEYGDDMTKWPEEWRDEVLTVLGRVTDEVTGFADMSEEQQLRIKNLFLRPFEITLTADKEDAEQKLTDLQIKLNNLVGKEWVVTLGVKGENSIDDVDAASKVYKKAMDDIISTESRLSKLEKEGKENTEQYTKTLLDNAEAKQKAGKAEMILKSYGADLPKSKTEKSNESSAKKAETAAEKAAKDRTKQAEAQLKIEEELAKQRRELQDAIADSEVAAIENNAERERRQREVEFEKQKRQLDKHVEEWKKKSFDLAKKEYEANPDNKKVSFYDTPVGKSGWQGQSLTAEQEGIRAANEKKLLAERKRQIKEENDAQIQALNEYIKEYGSIQEQRAAITAEYDDKIEKAGNEAQRASLRQQKKKLLEELSLKEIKKSINWEVVFDDLDKLSTESLKSLKEKLRKALDADDMTAENAKTIAEKIREIEKAISNRKDPWASYLPGLRKRRELTQDILEMENEIAGLVNMSSADSAKQDQAVSRFVKALSNTQNISEGGFRQYWQSIDSAKLEEIKAAYNIANASQDVKDAFTELETTTISLESSEAKLQQKRQDKQTRQEALDNFVKGGTVGQYFKDITKGFGVKDWANLVSQNAQSLSELIDNIGLGNKEFGEAVHHFSDGVSGFNSAIQSLESGDVFGAVNGIVDGYKGFGRMLGIGGGNSEAVNKAIDRLNDRNAILTDSIDRLNDTMSKQSGGKAIATYERMVRLQEELEKNIEKQLELQMEYHDAHHSFNAYWNEEGRLEKSRGMIDTMNALFGTNLKYDLSNINAESASAILQSPDLVYLIEHTGKGDYGDHVLEWIRQLAEQAGKTKESTDALYASLTADRTRENVFSDFLSDLYDFANGVDDVTENISKRWQQMVNEMIIRNTFSDRIDKFLNGDEEKGIEGWYDKLGELNEEYTKRVEENRLDDGFLSFYQSEIEILNAQRNEFFNGLTSEAERMMEDGILNPLEGAAKEAFESIRDSFKETILDMENDGKDFAKTIKKQLYEMIAEKVFEVPVTVGGNTFKDFDTYFEDWQKRVESVTNSTTMSEEQRADALKDYQKELEDVLKTTQKLARTYADMTGWTLEMKIDASPLANLGDDIISALGNADTDLAEWTNSIMQSMVDDLVKNMVLTEEFEQELRSLQEQYVSVMSDDSLTDEQKAAEIQKIADTIAGLYGEAEDATEAIRNLVPKIDVSPFKDLSDTFLDTLTDMDESAEDFKKKLEQTLVKDLIEKQILNVPITVDTTEGEQAFDNFDEYTKDWNRRYVAAVKAGNTEVIDALTDELVNVREMIINEAHALRQRLEDIANDTTFKDMASNFTSALMDMNKSAEDWSQEVGKMMAQKIFEGMMAENGLMERIQGIFNSAVEAATDIDEAGVKHIDWNAVVNNLDLTAASSDVISEFNDMRTAWEHLCASLGIELSDLPLSDLGNTIMDALTDVEYSADDFGKKIALQLMDEMLAEILDKRYTEQIKTIRKHWQQALSGEADENGIVHTIESVQEEITGLVSKIQNLGDTDPINQLTDSIKELGKAFDETFKGMGDSLASALMDLDTKASDFGRNIGHTLVEKIVKELIVEKELQQYLDAIQDAYDKAIADGGSMEDVLSAVIPKIDEAVAASEQWESAVEEIAKRFEDIDTPLDNLRSSFLSDLMDMERGVEDFANDINKMLTEAFINEFVLGDAFDAQLEEWKKRYLSIKESDLSEEQRAAEIRKLQDAIVAYEEGKKQQAQEIFDLMHYGEYKDQSATMNMAEKATYDQFEQYLGIALAQMINGEHQLSVQQQILDEIRKNGTEVGLEAFTPIQQLYDSLANNIGLQSLRQQFGIMGGNEEQSRLINATLTSMAQLTQQSHDNILTQVAMANSHLQMIREYSKKMSDQMELHMGSIDSKLSHLRNL